MIYRIIAGNAGTARQKYRLPPVTVHADTSTIPICHILTNFDRAANAYGTFMFTVLRNIDSCAIKGRILADNSARNRQISIGTNATTFLFSEAIADDGTVLYSHIGSIIIDIDSCAFLRTAVDEHDILEGNRHIALNLNDASTSIAVQRVFRLVIGRIDAIGTLDGDTLGIFERKARTYGLRARHFAVNEDGEVGIHIVYQFDGTGNGRQR